MEDVRWLGFDWGEHLLFRLRLLRAALRLGRAPRRGRPGLRRRPLGGGDPRPPRHPHRARHAEPVARAARWPRTSTSCARMRAGEFPDGAKVLRAKIDMAAGNINLRDPVLYRILHAAHPRTGDRLVHLPHLRLRARAVGRHRAHHPLASAPSSSRTTGRSTTGSRPPAGAVAPRQYRVRAPQPQLHGALQAAPAAAGQRRPRQTAGTTRACRPSPACAAAVTRPRRSATSPSGSASPSATAWSTSRCSSTASARAQPQRRAPDGRARRSRW
jgi:hypothetical protein